MSNAAPTVSAAEAKHRLTVAEGLLSAVGSGPRVLETTRKFLGLDVDPSAGEARRRLREYADGLRLVVEADAKADLPVVGEIGDALPPRKRGKRRRKSKALAEAAVIGNPPVPNSPSSQTGSGARQTTPWGGPNPGAIQATENEPFAVTSAGTFTTPPNLREADGWEACANCVFFLKGCNLYGRGRDGNVADFVHDGYYPVDNDDLCDSFLTLTPEVQRHVDMLDREDGRLAEAALAENGGMIVRARARVARSQEQLDEALNSQLEELWSNAAREASAMSRRRHGTATDHVGGRHMDKFGTQLLNREPSESALHYAMRRLRDRPASATANADGADELYHRAKLGVNHLKAADHVATEKERVEPAVRLSAALLEMVGGEIEEVKSSAYPGLDRSPKKNWVDKKGGLPSYIERIAKHLHYEKGKEIGHAIAIAVNVVKKMCGSGDTNFPGKQNVNAGSRAEACAAVAQWEKMKGATSAKGHAGNAARSPLKEAEAFEEAYALYEAAFKPIPPSWNLVESILSEIAATDGPDWYVGMADLDEALWNPVEHPRLKTRKGGGQFADALGGLEKGHGKLKPPSEMPAELTVDMAIGGVLAKWPNVKDWALDEPTTGAGGKKTWLVHVDLGDGVTHHISVDEDGVVAEAPHAAPPAAPTVVADKSPPGGWTAADKVPLSPKQPKVSEMSVPLPKPSEAPQIDPQFVKEHPHAAGTNMELMNWEHGIDVGHHVDVRWTNSGAGYAGHGKVLKKNAKSWQVEVGHDVPAHGDYGYKAGQKINVPRGDAFGSNLNAWSANNSIAPYGSTKGLPNYGKALDFPGYTPEAKAYEQATAKPGSSNYAPTGDSNVMSHMEPGTVFAGVHGELYKHHGDTWMEGKKGPVKAAHIEHLEKGTHKSVPYFTVHGQEYPTYAPEGTFTPHAPGQPSSADEVFGSLLKSVAGQHGVVNTVSGKNVVVTGVIPGHTRNAVHDLIKAAGGTPHSSVASDTHVLVTGGKVGATKIAAAQKKGVTVVPWDEFKHLVEGLIGVNETAYALVCGDLEETTSTGEVVRLRARRDVLARRLQEKVYDAKQRRAHATIGDDRYPIGDKAHAENALVRLNQGGLSPAEKAKVIAKAARFLGNDHPLVKKHRGPHA